MERGTVSHSKQGEGSANKSEYLSFTQFWTFRTVFARSDAAATNIPHTGVIIQERRLLELFVDHGNE